MAEFEKVTQTCEEALDNNQAAISVTEEQMKREFEKLHQFLREEEDARVNALREEQEEKEIKLKGRRESVEKVVQCLEERLQLFEEKLENGGDGDFLQDFPDAMMSTWRGYKEPDKDSGLLIDVARHLGNLQYEVWDRMKHIAPYSSVLLDPRTAGQALRFSPGLNGFHKISEWDLNGEEAVPLPDNPERFHPNSCVIGSEGYNSGVHCWEVEVDDSNNWKVGVASDSLCRKSEFETCPEAGLWCIGLQEHKYHSLTSPPQILHVDGNRLRRLRVRLDCDGGTLNFVNAETAAPLFAFTDCHAEKAYPYFETGSARGSLALLPRKVRVEAEPAMLGGMEQPEEDGKKSCTPGGEAGVVSVISSAEKDQLASHTAGEREALENEVNKHQGENRGDTNQQMKQEPAGTEMTADNNQSVRKMHSKTLFGMKYHVSLFKALKKLKLQI